MFTKHQNVLHTLSIKFCTSEWQGLTGASTSRTVPPITKISLRDPPIMGKNLHLPIVRTLATCHPRTNIISVKTLLKFVLIPFGELTLERCHVESRL